MLTHRLIHYSKKPLLRVKSITHSDHAAGAYKTPGLWVSVEGEDDWVNWCRNESFDLDGFSHATEIILGADANVHLLSMASQIDAFTRRFSPKNRPEWDRSLDWPAIRENWRGLIIAPYCYARRLAPHTSWYYAWDCASGVIWDAAAVKELRSIEPPNVKVAE
jgi:hypothetical protein